METITYKLTLMYDSLDKKGIAIRRGGVMSLGNDKDKANAMVQDLKEWLGPDKIKAKNYTFKPSIEEN